MSIIKIENLYYKYPDEEDYAINGVDLEIERGTFTAILGHNGSGKSTLAKHINGILVPTSGNVLVEGMDTSKDENLLGIRQKVGMVFQNPDNQIVSNVVEDDVAFAPENLGVPTEDIRTRVDESLKTVGMYDYRLHAPHLLSGGQKQRVAIAGVIAMQPDVIVLDEPTAMLDPQGCKEVISTVEKLCKEKGITIILITHHMYECVDADRLIVMSKGKIVKDGTPEEVFSCVEDMKREGLSVPVTTEILNRLNTEYGYDLSLKAISVENCAEEIKMICKGIS